MPDLSSDYIYVSTRSTGRDQSLCIRHNRRCFAVRGIKIVEGGKDGLCVYAQPENTGWIQGYLFLL